MYHQKKFFVLVLLAGLFFVGCSKDKDSDKSIKGIDIEKIMKLPYSELDSDEQKAKLEQECLDLLELCNAAKTSSAFETIRNFGNLLNEGQPELVIARAAKKVTDVFEFASVYGVYTWNASEKDWDFTESTTELKFVFPATQKAKTNNAILSVQSVKSDVSVTIYEYEDWDEDEEEDVEYEGILWLPKSVTSTLTVDNKEVAGIEVSAEYKNNKPIPVKHEFTFTTSDGYTYWYKIEKGNVNQVSMKMSYQNKAMFEVVFKSGIKLDEIFDGLINDEFDEPPYDLMDEVNAYVKLMDNLVLVYQVDLEKFVKKMNQIEDEYYDALDALDSDWNTNKDRYTTVDRIEKAYSDKSAKAFNDYMKVALCSTKENYKIADLFVVSEAYDEYWDYYYWNDEQNEWEWDWNRPEVKLYNYYKSNPYLKFNDDTIVEASVYFSDGFDDLMEKLTEFFDEFNE